MSDSKIAQQTARYTDDGSDAEHCSRCTMFSGGVLNPGCSLVRDPVSPLGWCRYFEPKNAKRTVAK